MFEETKDEKVDVDDRDLASEIVTLREQKMILDAKLSLLEKLHTLENTPESYKHRLFRYKSEKVIFFMSDFSAHVSAGY